LRSARRPPPELPSLRGRHALPGRSGWGVFDLLRGFGLFVQALFELLGAREYRSRLGLAVLANLVLWCTAAALAFYGVHGWIEAQSTALPEWLTSWISWAGAALSVLLTAGLALYVFPPLFVLLLFPILDPISRDRRRTHSRLDAPR
jgi:uncharacterized protein involved in cysteine biosynthesis